MALSHEGNTDLAFDTTVLRDYGNRYAEIAKSLRSMASKLELEIRLRGVLKALVTVELQLCGDLFLSLCCPDGGKNKINVLFSAGFVGNDTVIIEVTND